MPVMRSLTMADMVTAVALLRAQNIPTFENRGFYVAHVDPKRLQRAKIMLRRLKYRGGKKYRAACRIIRREGLACFCSAVSPAP